MEFFNEYVWPYLIGAFMALLLLFSLSFSSLYASELGSVVNELNVPIWAVGAGIAADYALGKTKAVKANSVLDLVILGLQAILHVLRSRRK